MGNVEKLGIGNVWPVGFGFRPIDNELINHYLKRKLLGRQDASRVIPEINIYQWEPQTLFETYNATSDYPSNGGECFFYCTRDGKNRKTRTGFWKETGKKRSLRSRDGEPIGSKKIFVYHKAQQRYGRKSLFSMHEYHLNFCTNPMIGVDQGPAMEFVLCRIINREIKKINPDSPSEYIDPDLVTLGSTAANPREKAKEGSPQFSIMGSVEKPVIGNAWPVGFGFRPTEDELINHHLTRKLRGLEEAVRVIPELNIYQWEPQTLFETYNALSCYPSDGGECFFYCTRDGKNRKTLTGFWKETGKKRTLRGCDREIGSKRIFVYHEAQQPYGRKSSFSMHEYHLICCTNPTIGADQGPAKEFVLCRIINRKLKKIKPHSPSECIEPDLVAPSGTASNQGDTNNKASSQVCDPQHNLIEAEAGAGHGDDSEMEFMRHKESIFNEHRQFTYNDLLGVDLLDGPVNDRDNCPDRYFHL